MSATFTIDAETVAIARGALLWYHHATHTGRIGKCEREDGKAFRRLEALIDSDAPGSFESDGGTFPARGK